MGTCVARKVAIVKIPSVYQEPFYDDGRTSETERLESLTIPLAVRALGTAVLAAAESPRAFWFVYAFMLVCGVVIGWFLRGLWGPLYDQRGWAALVVFSIVGSAWMVNERNRGR